MSNANTSETVNDQLHKYITDFSADIHKTLNSPKPEVSTLYHYTNLDSALSIVANNTIRVTSAYHLNDATETSYIKPRIHEAISNTKWCNDLLRQEIAKKMAVSPVFTLLFSLTEADDLLSQWRAYGNVQENPGIALGFQLPALPRTFQDLQVLEYPEDSLQYAGGLFQVTYDTDSGKEVVARALNALVRDLNERCKQAIEDKIADESYTANYFAAAFDYLKNIVSACVKHEGFREEREWRIVVQLPYTTQALKFRRKRHLITPYAELPTKNGRILPISHVRFGSVMAIDETSCTSFKHLMLNRKHDLNKIVFSNTSLPLRV